MRLPTESDWRNWRGSFSELPAVAAFPCSGIPPSWLAWWKRSPFSVLLETGKAGRYTILAPRIERMIVCGEESAVLLRSGDAGIGEDGTLPGGPLEALREFMKSRRAPRLAGAPPFIGGLIGFFSYDLARLLEKLPERATDDLGVPLAAFALCRRTFVYDHTAKILFCAVTREVDEETSDRRLAGLFTGAMEETAVMKSEWDSLAMPQAAGDPNQLPSPGGPISTGARFSLSQDQFKNAVNRVKDYIRSGDTYQTNLSLRETRKLRAAPEEVYEQLRRINPSPYMGLLRLPGLCLVSGSPELLIRLSDGKLEARPIAGTRPRGSNAATDRRLNRDLTRDAKERAEHLMLVDLIRNDLGRVSLYGSVRVSEFMTVEKYSHVMHIVSHVEGRLAKNLDLFDAIAATFPGGTITGAPKVRTMEIIEELEPVRRGPYTGSIGWIGFDGNMELNITIRTLLAMNGEAHVQAGAGIVIDSDPEREYEESINKARALWVAVEAAERALPSACLKTMPHPEETLTARA